MITYEVFQKLEDDQSLYDFYPCRFSFAVRFRNPTFCIHLPTKN